jgi:hypothetical protein
MWALPEGNDKRYYSLNRSLAQTEVILDLEMICESTANQHLSRIWPLYQQGVIAIHSPVRNYVQLGELKINETTLTNAAKRDISYTGRSRCERKIMKMSEKSQKEQGMQQKHCVLEPKTTKYDFVLSINHSVHEIKTF